MDCHFEVYENVNRVRVKLGLRLRVKLTLGAKLYREEKKRDFFISSSNVSVLLTMTMMDKLFFLFPYKTKLFWL